MDEATDFQGDAVVEEGAPVQAEGEVVAAIEDSISESLDAGLDAPETKAPVVDASSDTQRKLYVGNLGWNVEDEDLFELFSEFGELEYWKHMESRDEPGRKRGFGFVTFATPEGAAAASAALDGADFSGRNLRVNLAAEKPPPRERAPRSNFGRRQEAADGTKLYVGNLNFITDDSTLTDIFTEFGTIESAVHVSDKFDPSRKRGFGFITFSDKESADKALAEMDGAEVDGRVINVKVAAPQEARPPRRDFNREY